MTYEVTSTEEFVKPNSEVPVIPQNYLSSIEDLVTEHGCETVK